MINLCLIQDQRALQELQKSGSREEQPEMMIKEDSVVDVSSIQVGEVSTSQIIVLDLLLCLKEWVLVY